jgi:hypothetical protein
MTRNWPRRSVSRQLTVLTTALLGVAVTVALVGGTRANEASAGAVPTGVPGPVASSAFASVPGPDSGSVPGTGSAAGANPDCLTDDLTGTLIGQPRSAGSGRRDTVLRLTNSSGRACRVQGWADIALVTPPGEVVRVPTRKIDQPGGGVIVLAPEASAWARVQWDTCVPGRSGCGVGVTVQYIVDRDSTGSAADPADVPEAGQDGITMRALRVGPLQQTRAAALA